LEPGEPFFLFHMKLGEVNDNAEGFFEKEMTQAAVASSDGSVSAMEMFAFPGKIQNGSGKAVIEMLERENDFLDRKIMVLFELTHTPN